MYFLIEIHTEICVKCDLKIGSSSSPVFYPIIELEESIKRIDYVGCETGGSRSLAARIERIDSIMPRRKIKLGLGLRAQTMRLLKHYELYNFYLLLGSLNRKDESETRRRSGAVEKGWRDATEQDGAHDRPQRSNINVECLWLYRFILQAGKALNIVSIESGRSDAASNEEYINKVDVTAD
ncbi:hypothetical protein ACJJTC_012691 [Scirpophaga incertulas]